MTSRGRSCRRARRGVLSRELVDVFITGFLVGKEDAHAAGAYDEVYARRDAEALEKDAVLLTKGPTGAAKVLERQRARERAKKSHKRKKEDNEAVAREETELKEWILMLRERLGNGATKIVLCVFVGDKYGGLLETKDYKADVAALAKLEDENADALLIKRKRNNLARKRTRALQRVAAEKAEQRVEALAGQVEELLAEECYLGELLSMT